MATKNRFPRFVLKLLAALACGCLAPTAVAGGPFPAMPDLDFYDFQLFAPPDLQEYAIRPDPNEGVFFNYERVYWAMTPPQSQPILNDFFIPVQPLSASSVAKLNNDLISAGYPGSGLYIFGSDPLRFDLNTNWMRTDMSWGNRFEGGWIYEDFGMLFNYYDSGPQSQSFSSTNAFALNSPTTQLTQTTGAGTGTVGGVGNVLVVTTITATSPPPDHLISQSLTQNNLTEMRSGGFAWMIRRNLSRAGSGQMNTVRFSFGPKFLQVTDLYSINYNSSQSPFPPSGTTPAGLPTGITTNPGVGGVTSIDPNAQAGVATPLQSGAWNTSSYNNIVGPELGLNYQVESGRWAWETDLRFVAGMNWQNTLYRGSNFPAGLGADYFRSTYTFANTVSQSANGSAAVSAPPLFVQIYGVSQTNTTNTTEHSFVFTPIGEWRLRGRYKVSKAVSLSVGYTGMWLGGITRASTNTEFKPALRPVTTATQNGPPTTVTTPNPQYNPTEPTDPVNNPQFITSTVNTWTPPPINAGNTQLREYNSVSPRAGGDLGYMFVNGVDFGIEVNY